ncbi:MAG TPA: ferritin-like domain-containing protein [Pseudolabrys sp.]|nr:ferritin-like domain-containing protein [Pseudolabrys sp.]
MPATSDRLLEWLRDAHAMEQQAETMMDQQASRLENYPELKARIEQHIRETRAQGERVRVCIERLGGNTSSIKDISSKMMAFAQGMGGMTMSDEVVKGAMASYTFEHFEIAAYRVLIAAAEEAGDAETKRVCQENLAEEERMAAWLEEHLLDITHKNLRRGEMESSAAKR